jgi:hypothetical protein
MSNLLNAMRQHDSQTANGAVTNSTSLNAVVDMFFLAGASRKMDEQAMINVFVKAFDEDPILAIKCLFWSRDVRGGAGERRFFHVIMKNLIKNFPYPELIDQLMINVPEYGYWKDVFTLEEPTNDNLNWLTIQLEENPNRGLLAKWWPRKGKWFSAAHKYLKVTPKEFRKRLVELTKVVETQMCNREFEAIKYEQVPSQAFQKYKKAFEKRDETRFVAFINKALKGEVKINSATLFPYQLYQSFCQGKNTKTLDAQWQNLPDYVGEGSFLPMCDVSGSMGGLPMEMSVSLGVYLSERNKSVFKDAFLTFSEKPELQILKGNVADRFRQLRGAHWEMNTNLLAAFELILTKAVQAGLSRSDMPDTILIISDMEFDPAWMGKTNYETIQMMYENAGYVAPKIAFWNVKGREGNVPVNAKAPNVALISGASPAIVKNVLAGKDFTPQGIMLETLNSDRYKVFNSLVW